MVDTRSTKIISPFWNNIHQHPEDASKNAGGMCVTLNHPTIQPSPISPSNPFFGAIAISTTIAVACVYIAPSITDQHHGENIDNK